MAHGKLRQAHTRPVAHLGTIVSVMVRHCVRWSRRWKSLSTPSTPVHSVAKTTWNELVSVFGNAVHAKRPWPAVPTSTQPPPQLLFVQLSVVYVTCANNRWWHFRCVRFQFRWTWWKRRKLNKGKIRIVSLSQGLWPVEWRRLASLEIVSVYYS